MVNNDRKAALMFNRHLVNLLTGFVVNVVVCLFHRAVIDLGSRSRVNIPFRVGKGHEDLEKKFVQEAKSQGLDGLAGHRSVPNMYYVLHICTLFLLPAK